MKTFSHLLSVAHRISTLAVLMVLLTLASAARAQTCAAPTNVSITQTLAGNAQITFTPSPTATSYTVRYFWTGDSTATGTITYNIQGSPAPLTGLIDGRTYVVFVTSNCASGGGSTTATAGPFYYQVPGGGGPQPGNCPPVTGLTVQTAGTTATVRFNPVAGAQSYTVQYRVLGTNLTTSVTTNSVPLTLSNLMPGSSYAITVITNCANGTSSGMTSGTFTITAPPTACNPPTNVQATTTSSTTATIRFTPVTGAQYYTVQYYPVGDSARSVFATGSSSPINLTGLRPGTSYIAYVSTVCANGRVSTMVQTTFRTTAATVCGSITNLTITPTSSSTALLGFTPGAGNTGFTVVYWVAGDTTTTQLVSAATAPISLMGLVVGQTYTIRIWSHCSGASTATPVNTTYQPRPLSTRSSLGGGTFSAYPNPAQHSVSLVLPAVPGAARAQVSLLNAVGQQVRTLTVDLSTADNRARLDLTGVAPGLYTLRVLAGTEAASQRLAVE